MKTKTLVMILAAVAFCSALNAQESRTVYVESGDEIRVKASAAPTPFWVTDGLSVDRSEVKDVIKAMEILLRYVPEKYADGWVEITTGGSSSISWAVSGGAYERKTKADILRDKARSLESEAANKRTAADKSDEEQKEIQWAREVLRKWKAKL